MIFIADLLAQWRNKGLDDDQLNEVRLGLQHGLSAAQINVFAKEGYDFMQMQEIRLGLEHGLTEKQMAVFLDPSIDYRNMRINRMQLEDVNAVNENAEADLRKKHLKNVLIAVIIILCITAGAIIAVYSSDYIRAEFQTLDLKLKEDEVTVEYGSAFNAADYIQSATEADNVQLTLPKEIDTKKIGRKTLKYELSNGNKTKTAYLTVNIVDTESPVIYLKQDSVTLTRGEEQFSCSAYLDHAEDNADGDISDSVQCTKADESKGTQTITYSVKDSSGNEADKDFTLTFKDPEPEPTVTPETIIIYRNTGGGSGGGTSSNNKQNSQGGQQSQSAAAASHGSKTYMFADGYDMDTAYNACVADMNATGGSCTPISSGDGIYTGYRLDY